jgi:hypothetical protein
MLQPHHGASRSLLSEVKRRNSLESDGGADGFRIKIRRPSHFQHLNIPTKFQPCFGDIRGSETTRSSFLQTCPSHPIPLFRSVSRLFTLSTSHRLTCLLWFVCNKKTAIYPQALTRLSLSIGCHYRTHLSWRWQELPQEGRQVQVRLWLPLTSPDPL